jgi:hypothetical protein
MSISPEQRAKEAQSASDRGKLEAAKCPKYPDQKFHRGDRVTIDDKWKAKYGNIGTIVGSYNDQFSWMTHGRKSDREPSYTIKFDDGNEVSWYAESTLTKV